MAEETFRYYVVYWLPNGCLGSLIYTGRIETSHDLEAVEEQIDQETKTIAVILNWKRLQ